MGTYIFTEGDWVVLVDMIFALSQHPTSQVFTHHFASPNATRRDLAVMGAGIFAGIHPHPQKVDPPTSPHPWVHLLVGGWWAFFDQDQMNEGSFKTLDPLFFDLKVAL